MHHHAMGRSRRRLGLTLRSLTAATLTASALALAFAPTVHASGQPTSRPQTTPCDPVAVDDSYFTEFETVLNEPASGVLINDTTCDLTPSYGAASSGVFAGNGDGSFTYTPTGGFTGNATVPYDLVGPDQIIIVSATITIFVAPPPCVVNLVDDAYATPMDTPLNVVAPGYGGNDVETCSGTYALVSSTSNGTLAFNADGSFDYTPNLGFVGVDVFEYTVELAPPPGFQRVLSFFAWRAPAGAPTPDVATVTITIEAPPPTTTVPAPTTTVPAPTTTVPAPTTTVAPSTGSTLPATR